MLKRDENWIDGLRGVASFMVVCGHLCTSFAPYIHDPAPGPGEVPYLFQRPILRMVVGGRTAVAFFFLITGYVNCIGPLSRAMAGNTDDAFLRISNSSFARSARLVLPAMFATFFSWAIANVNGYHFIQHVDATWIRQGYWAPSGNLGAAIRDYVYYCIETWTTGWNGYDGTQWTLTLFLEGAMMVYMTIVATMFVTPKTRRVVIAVLYLYGWMDPAFGPVKTTNIAIGMFVADLHVALGDQATELLPRVIPFLMIIVGLFFSSFPQNSPEWAPWSDFMRKVMVSITHVDADIRRHWDSLGASIMFLAIFFSGPCQRLLTSKVFNFAGRVSFPVYLIHNTLMKTILAWMLYLPSYLNPKFNDKGEQMDLEAPGRIHMTLAILAFFYILYRLAYLWTCTIDVLIDKWVKAGMRWASGQTASPHEKQEAILAK